MLLNQIPMCDLPEQSAPLCLSTKNKSTFAVMKSEKEKKVENDLSKNLESFETNRTETIQKFSSEKIPENDFIEKKAVDANCKNAIANQNGQNEREKEIEENSNMSPGVGLFVPVEKSPLPFSTISGSESKVFSGKTEKFDGNFFWC